MNWVVTGRKVGEIPAAGIARAAVARTGAEGAGVIFSPACAVAQMEQVWRDVAESSACEWTACTVPITHTRATQSTHTALTNAPRFADTFNMLSPCCFRGVAFRRFYP